MRHLFSATAVAALSLALSSATALSQGANDSDRVFDSENAILDTSIPFAIGARQAQQNLRGAFGWDTFQEGLVEGVYFRFDPDGYARFSVTPRLDTDVFEVICRPRTYNCQARKGPLEVLLDDRGRIQLRFDQITAGDQLVISEGVSELPLPERVLRPLDQRLEALLSTGGDLVQRRGDNEISSTSLQGFAAVVAYLRWVSARQDYTVLPRDWPVPNSSNEEGSITQASSWNSPMQLPQRVVVQQVPASDPEVAALADEMGQLRSELQKRASNDDQAPMIGAEDIAMAERVARLEIGLDYLRKDVAALREMTEATMPGYDQPLSAEGLPMANGLPAGVVQDLNASGGGSAAIAASAASAGSATNGSVAMLASALAKELGITEDAAAILAVRLGQMSQTGPSPAALPVPTSMPTTASSLLEDTMVRQILNGIETTTPPIAPAMPAQDYQTLSDYLAAVAAGQ